MIVLLDRLELLDVGHERHHDLDPRYAADLDARRGGLEDRARLHLEQSGDDDAETHAAQPEHRVLLVQLVHGLQHPQVALALLAARLGHRDPHRQLGDVGQELVQRRVEQPDRDGQPVHRLEDADEVLALQRQQLGELTLLLLVGVGEDQPLDQVPALAEEHVLGAAQPDALRAEAPGARGVLGVVGVGAHRHPPRPVGVAHHPVDGLDEVVGVGGLGVELALEVLHDRRGHHGHLAQVDLAGGAVDRDDVALVHLDAVRRAHDPLLGVDVERLGTADAGLAHATRHDRGVRGLAAA